jgi:hypothetical protein
MKVLKRCFGVVLLVAVVGALAATPAVAATEPAAGAFAETLEVDLGDRLAGGNEIVHLTRDAFITGTYTGIGHADQTAIVHSDGSFNFHQTIEFTGLACGQPVTLTFSVIGKGDLVANTLSATYTVTGPTDVGKGHGTLGGIAGVGGTYAGDVSC